MTQQEFADLIDLPRESINQYLDGPKAPGPMNLLKVLEWAGLELKDCIDIPEDDAVRLKRRNLFTMLQEIVDIGNRERVDGIAINLEDIAEGSRNWHKRQNKRKKGQPKHKTVQEKQNLAPNEKKKASG